MKRIRRLGKYQKGLLIFMLGMILLFAVIYPVTIAREGFAYQGAILTPGRENGSVVYSGKVRGKQASFAVDGDGTVESRYDGRAYGPYTVREDPSAIPEGIEPGSAVTGVEIRQGEVLLFRGGAMRAEDGYWLYHEDGSVEIGDMLTVMGNGVADSAELSATDILELVEGPELTHKGTWVAWFAGVFVCILTALSILFADELFRWSLAFRIRDADQAEPSDWELIGRYASWTLLPLLAMFAFIMGLL